MARKMPKAPTHAWRAVVVTRFQDGTEHTEYMGPYWRKQDATGLVAIARNTYRPSWSTQFVNGWVESAPLGEWKEVM